MISTEILEKAKALNTEAAELNEKRKQAEWAKKKAEEDLSKALAEYNAKYGTSLGVADIEKAYTAEEKKVQEQIAKVEAEIEAVKNGATEVVEVAKATDVADTTKVAEVAKATEVEKATDVAKVTEVEKATDVAKATEVEEATDVARATEVEKAEPIAVASTASTTGVVESVPAEPASTKPVATESDEPESSAVDFDFSAYLN